MGNFVNVSKEGKKKYLSITENPFMKILAIEKKLSLHRFGFLRKYKQTQIFYDTQTNLLEKAGVALSKKITPEKTYFKVERQSFLPQSLSRKNEKIFIHEVGTKDKVSDHAFYLVDGIKSLFTTSFTVDLENVLKNITPKITISSDVTEYQVLSGGGFKANLKFLQTNIKNLETKRKAKMVSVTTTLDCQETYLPAFEYFNNQIEKYCKDLVPFEESLFDYTHRLTKPLPVKKKLTKEEKEKLKQQAKKLNDTIEG